MRVVPNTDDTGFQYKALYFKVITEQAIGARQSQDEEVNESHDQEISTNKIEVEINKLLVLFLHFMY